MSAVDLKASLYTLLANDASINALVGARVYPMWAPYSATLPYIVMTRVTEEDFAPTMAGPGSTDFAAMQFDIWAETSLTAETIKRALRDLLDGFTGVMVPAYICSFRFTGALDGPLSPTDGGGEATARITMTAEVWWQ